MLEEACAREIGTIKRDLMDIISSIAKSTAEGGESADGSMTGIRSE